jgi:quinol monooxygenase YgiN
MDAVFGVQFFRDEICWQRSTAKGHAFTRFPSAQDTILYYSKGPEPKWRTQYLPHRDEYIKSHYASVEPETGRHFTLGDCLNPNSDRPNLTYEWNGQVRFHVMKWDIHPDKEEAYTRWAETAIMRTLAVPGVIEFRGYVAAAGASQVVATYEFADLAAWAAWASNEDIKKVIHELHTLALNANIEVWGPSPLTPAPIRPGK